MRKELRVLEHRSSDNLKLRDGCLVAADVRCCYMRRMEALSGEYDLSIRPTDGSRGKGACAKTNLDSHCDV